MSEDKELIWNEFHERLRGFIARRVDNATDVEDILQDVFLRIHQHLTTVRSADRLTAWIFQITRHAIIDYYRAPQRRREALCGHAMDWEAEERSINSDTPFAESNLETLNQELAACLSPMIERLPHRYREAVVLVELEGVPHRVAAERLGLSISGVKSRVQRGRRKLKHMLEQCCHIRVDQVGNVMDYEVKDPACRSCRAEKTETGGKTHA